MHPHFDPPPSTAEPAEQRRRQVALSVAALGILGAASLGAYVTDDGPRNAASAEALMASTTTAAPDTSIAIDVPDLAIPDPAQNAGEASTVVEQERADGGCTIGALSLRFGATGGGVRCLQQALIASGGFTGEASGSFDDATVRAVMAFQTVENLFVDGVVGRESAIALDIWPDEESFLVRTPPPPAGATDLWGATLSPVASAGDDAPPLPDNSGTGRRVVYDRAGQRVWAINDDGAVIRSWLVSGSQYGNEVPGTHEVYSRSDMSTAWNGKAWLPQMIRWYKTEIGALGFHSIPLSVKDNSAYQTTEELGTRLSGGCQRQHPLDAAFMWEFATIGTKVVVT
jgi:peptidoglycan hydrolase-like protein with peptidoglycan-binding domain